MVWYSRFSFSSSCFSISQISGTARLERKCEPEGREHHHRARQPGSTFRTSSHSPTLSGEGSRTGMFRPDRPQSVDDLRKLLRLKVQDGSDLQTAAKTLRDSYQFFVSLQRLAEEKRTSCYEMLEHLRHF